MAVKADLMHLLTQLMNVNEEQLLFSPATKLLLAPSVFSCISLQAIFR